MMLERKKIKHASNTDSDVIIITEASVGDIGSFAIPRGPFVRWRLADGGR